MSEYTYKDIIIDPTSEEARNCIGKVVYYSDSPTECLYYANKNNTVYCGTLKEIVTSTYHPFVSGINDDTWGCIIPKKEEPKPEWVPFKFAVEFLDAYEDANYSVTNGTIENRLLNYGGIWLINTVSFASYIMLTEVCADGLILGTSPEIVSWEELLRDYTFLDGTPCGKIKEQPFD